MKDFGFYNMDCMEGMKEFPDKYFDLAIVDPQYGIGASKESMRSGTRTKNKELYKDKKWDDAIPPKEYFYALIRVSQNQIIWGANYFCKLLPVSRGWIYWHKFVLTENYSQGELAWSSFDCVLKYFEFRYQGNYVGNTLQTASFIEKRIHPTQKPVALYRWLLQNYAKQGDKILDTHVRKRIKFNSF